MSDIKKPFLDPMLLGQWLARYPHIWQMALLDAGKLASYAEERSVSYWHVSARFSQSQGRPLAQMTDPVTLLWQVGLLRADRVISEHELQDAGLHLIGRDEHNRFLYTDARELSPTWFDNISQLVPFPDEVELEFHCFRYYVLYRLRRLLDLRIFPIQMFNADEYPELLQSTIIGFQRYAASENFLRDVAYWNDVTALAIAAEPVWYPPLFNTISFVLPLTHELWLEQLRLYEVELTQHFRQLVVADLEEIRRDICIAANMLDSNKTVHTMLRVAKGAIRLNLEDHLGGAMHLLTMAEMLRRQTEAAHAVQLPEEDELGFGWPSQDMKLHRYGNNRLLDGDSAPVNEFLRASNLDYGLRARWYVEGHTEYYAACYGCEQLGADHVELINLQGEVAQRGGKGVAFRQNLRNDVANGIFSYISVDDENNYAKAVRKAAEDDEICGLFAIATPDFEFHNFTLSELEEVLWSIAEDNGISPEVRPRLHAAIAKTKNATELLTVAGQVSPELNIKKGKVWGERLMAYALEHRGGRDGHIRPVIDILEDAHRTTHYSYHYIRTHTRINPLTGRPIDRNPADK